MKVLHLVHVFPPASRGGTESYVLRLAAAQRDAGDDVLILSGSDEGPPEPELREEIVEGLRVLRLRPPERRAASLDGRDAAARRLLQEVLRRERPGVLHLHHWHNVTTDAVAAAREAGVAAVVTLHDLFSSCPLFFRLPDDVHLCRPERRREVCARCLGDHHGGAIGVIDEDLRRRESVLRTELELAGAVLAVSEEARGFLAAVPALAGPTIRTLPLPAATLPPAAGLPPPQAIPGRLRLVSWGGLVPGKGLHHVIDACEAIETEGTITLDHYGPILLPSYAQRLRSTARRVRLTLHGPFEPSVLAAHGHRYDLAVFPSLFLETHGFVVDEALQLGLPVVVSDRGAPHWRVGPRGVVFPAGNPSTLVPILEGFLRDPDSLETLRAAAPPPPATLEEHRLALAGIYEAARTAAAGSPRTSRR